MPATFGRSAISSGRVSFAKSQAKRFSLVASEGRQDLPQCHLRSQSSVCSVDADIPGGMRPHTADSIINEGRSPRLPSTKMTAWPERRSSTAMSNWSRRRARYPVPAGVSWQWEHRTGFRAYTEEQNARIEFAYRRGDSKVRLKSGKAGSTPMEIFFVDMVQYDPVSNNTRKVQRVGPNGCFVRMHRLVNEAFYSWYTGKIWRETYKQYQSRRGVIEGNTHEFSLVEDMQNDSGTLYHESGICTRIAQSNCFFAGTMLTIMLNALWLAYDLDNNPATVWTKADIQFQIAEHTFCIVFSLELLVRFGAFRRKRDCLVDPWFRFDLALVILMFAETWLFPLALYIVGTDSDDGASLEYLSVLRVARLLRLSRMTRIIRAVPEVMTLMKGIVTAFRSVFFTLLLLLLVLYVFGILFRSGAIGLDIEDPYFASVPRAMWTLLMHGTFLDSVAAMMDKILNASSMLTFCFFFFILLSSFTVVNMLIGIVCDVMFRVKREEEEDADAFYLRNNLLDILECYDKDDDRSIGREEFELLLNNPEALDAIKKFGTDADGLVTVASLIFENDAGGTKLSFDDLLGVILRLQGQHSAKVTDIVDLRKYIKQCQQTLRSELDEGLQRLDEKFAQVSDGVVVRSKSATIDIRLNLSGQLRVQRHAAGLTVEKLQKQFASELGDLVATDAHGVILGPELTLSDLAAANAEALLEVHLSPAETLEDPGAVAKTPDPREMDASP